MDKEKYLEKIIGRGKGRLFTIENVRSGDFVTEDFSPVVLDGKSYKIDRIMSERATEKLRVLRHKIYQFRNENYVYNRETNLYERIEEVPNVFLRLLGRKGNIKN